MASGAGGQKSNSKEPKPGDMLAFQRSGYEHVGLYVGNGMVVHKGPADGDAAKPGVTKPGLVKKDMLKDVAGTSSWRIYNVLDNQYTPRPAQEIVQEANRLVGQKQPYNVLDKNCEQFASEIRYGAHKSPQVDHHRETLNRALEHTTADNMGASFPFQFKDRP
ncbi:phospholipase A and acyltransferase 3-like isoform 2-T4 [Pholidichthys leucotaenia]